MCPHLSNLEKNLKQNDKKYRIFFKYAKFISLDLSFSIDFNIRRLNTYQIWPGHPVTPALAIHPSSIVKSQYNHSHNKKDYHNKCGSSNLTYSYLIL